MRKGIRTLCGNMEWYSQKDKIRAQNWELKLRVILENRIKMPNTEQGKGCLIYRDERVCSSKEKTELGDILVSILQAPHHQHWNYFNSHVEILFIVPWNFCFHPLHSICAIPEHHPFFTEFSGTLFLLFSPCFYFYYGQFQSHGTIVLGRKKFSSTLLGSPGWSKN